MLHFYCHYRRCRGVEGSKGKLVSIFKWVEGNHSVLYAGRYLFGGQ